MKIKAILLCSVVVLTLAVPCRASEQEAEAPPSLVTEYYSPELTDPPVFDATETAAGVEGLNISAKSCILMEVTTGEVLYESESHIKLSPASITKIMSLLLTVEAIESGQLSVDTVLAASPYACSMGGSQIWLEPGEKMTVDHLLKAAVIGSANDATVVLGEAIAGSEESFVEMMNERAAELGMNDTHFVNCTGLDADGHLTSAYDVAVMSRELIKHSLITEYSTVWMDSLREGKSELVNTNKLVRYYDGCTGLKTGTTSKAGACLSATAERDGLKLVAVVMGASNSNDRFNGARKLLDFGFANWSFITVTSDPEQFHDIPVTGGLSDRVSVESRERKSFLVEKSKVKTLCLTTELSEALKAPVEEGSTVGVTRVFVGGREIGTVSVTATDSVLELTFGRMLKILLKNVFCV